MHSPPELSPEGRQCQELPHQSPPDIAIRFDGHVAEDTAGKKRKEQVEWRGGEESRPGALQK